MTGWLISSSTTITGKSGTNFLPLLTPNHSCPGTCLHNPPAVNLAWVCRDGVAPLGKQPVRFTRKPAVLQRVYDQWVPPLREVTFSGIQGLFF